MESPYSSDFLNPLIPLKKGFVIRAEHFMRYQFAKNYLKKHRSRAEVVYDVSCGDGYGTKILFQVCQQVIGFDNSKKYLKEAEKNSKTRNSQFVFCDLNKQRFAQFVEKNKMPKPTAIVCLETLEHIDNPQQLMSDFYSLLPKNGVLIFSVPNAYFEPQKDGIPKNPYHKHLFPLECLKKFTKNAGFKKLKIYGQPTPNFLLHKLRWLLEIIDKKSLKSEKDFIFLSKLVATPIPFLVTQSYSFIVIAGKN